MSHLRPVDEAYAQPVTLHVAGGGLPDFEGQPVHYTRMKLAAVSDLEAGDDAVRLDDVVKMYVEGRVTRVDHVVDEAGKLKRVHTIKVVDAVHLPWNLNVDDLLP